MSIIQELGMPAKLKLCLGMNEDDQYDAFQKKLIINIKNCSDNYWAYVNSYYDGDVETSYRFFENAREVYNSMYEESGEDVFGPGFHKWGEAAKSFLKDTRFAGKKFKSLVVLFYTAKLYDEAAPEIELNDKQMHKILEQLKEIKSEVSSL